MCTSLLARNDGVGETVSEATDDSCVAERVRLRASERAGEVRLLGRPELDALDREDNVDSLPCPAEVAISSRVREGDLLGLRRSGMRRGWNHHRNSGESYREREPAECANHGSS